MGADGAIKYTVGLDTSGATGPLGSLTAQLQNGLGAMIRLGASCVAFGGALDGVRRAVQALFHAISEGDRLAALSSQTGQSVRDLVILKQAFKLADVEGGALSQRLMMLQRVLGGVNEQGEPTAYIFDKLGLSLESLKSMPAIDQLAAIGRAIRTLPTQADQAAAAMKIFGRSGGEMLAFFRDTAALDDARESAGGLAEAMARHAAFFKQMGDSWTAFKAQLAGVFADLAGQLLPIFRQAKFTVQAFAESFSPVIRVLGFCLETVKALAGGFGVLAVAIIALKLSQFLTALGLKIAGLVQSTAALNAETAALAQNSAAHAANAASRNFGGLAGGISWSSLNPNAAGGFVTRGAGGRFQPVNYRAAATASWAEIGAGGARAAGSYAGAAPAAGRFTMPTAAGAIGAAGWGVGIGLAIQGMIANAAAAYKLLAANAKDWLKDNQANEKALIAQVRSITTLEDKSAAITAIDERRAALKDRAGGLDLGDPLRGDIENEIHRLDKLRDYVDRLSDSNLAEASSAKQAADAEAERLKEMETALPKLAEEVADLQERTAEAVWSEKFGTEGNPFEQKRMLEKKRQEILGGGAAQTFGLSEQQMAGQYSADQQIEMLRERAADLMRKPGSVQEVTANQQQAQMLLQTINKLLELGRLDRGIKFDEAPETEETKQEKTKPDRGPEPLILSSWQRMGALGGLLQGAAPDPARRSADALDEIKKRLDKGINVLNQPKTTGAVAQ